MKRCFKECKFSQESRERIEQANEIIEDFMEQGLKLTLRQLYYQFVSKALIPNEERSYKNLGNLISKARLAGEIDWDSIEDRMRQPVVPLQFTDLDHAVRAISSSYRLSRRHGQETYVELWVEKDALASVLEPIARRHHITLMVNRGYSSSSAMYDAAQRIERTMVDNDSECAIVLYLGDLDPSGEDMVRDIQERLHLFGCYAAVGKLALTMEQVEQYQPPPNPTKLTDSRAQSFIEKYGNSSWEVDALPPTVLRDLIETAISTVTDEEAWKEILEQEDEDKKKLRSILG